MGTIQAAKATKAATLFDLPMYLPSGEVSGRAALEAQAKDKLFSDVIAAGYTPIERTFGTRWYGPAVGVASVAARILR